MGAVKYSVQSPYDKKPGEVTKAHPPHSAMAAEVNISVCLASRVVAQASGGLGFLWMPLEA